MSIWTNISAQLTKRNDSLNWFVFQPFDIGRIWWRLRVVRTKFDIYILMEFENLDLQQEINDHC
jgi:hypothetical protein